MRHHYRKDEWGWRYGEVFGVRIHEFHGKWIVAVADATTGQYLYKKTHNHKNGAEAEANRLLHAKHNRYR
jgi:hypothetical protein